MPKTKNMLVNKNCIKVLLIRSIKGYIIQRHCLQCNLMLWFSTTKPQPRFKLFFETGLAKLFIGWYHAFNIHIML